MTADRVLILCNALADSVRLERGVTTDSPAATRKVVMMASVLRKAGVNASLISLGRGQPDKSRRFFPFRPGRIGRVPVLYCPFAHVPVISEILSLGGPLPLLWKHRNNARQTVLLLYNRMLAYLPAIWFARLLGYRVALDLEDGETILTGRSLKAAKGRALTWLVDRACTNGALLACRALADATKLRPVLAYHGVVEPRSQRDRFTGSSINVLLGGTVEAATGADLLIEAIERLRKGNNPWAHALHVHVTGSGDSLARLRVLAAEPTQGPILTVHGRLDSNDYAALLADMDVGLALKPNGSALANTTFPSKVVEIANEGLLTLTTDISDVRAVLGDGAIYLERDDPALLAERLCEIARDPAAAALVAQRGTANVSARCGPEEAANALRQFLFARAV